MQDVGFIGLGAMGMAMAKDLLQAGFRLHVFNRTREKAEQLAGEPGVTIASQPGKLGAAARTIISMVADDGALEQIVTGPGGLSEGAAGIVHALRFNPPRPPGRCHGQGREGLDWTGFALQASEDAGLGEVTDS